MKQDTDYIELEDVDWSFEVMRFLRFMIGAVSV